MSFFLLTVVPWKLDKWLLLDFMAKNVPNSSYSALTEHLYFHSISAAPLLLLPKEEQQWKSYNHVVRREEPYFTVICIHSSYIKYLTKAEFQSSVSSIIHDNI